MSESSVVTDECLTGATEEFAQPTFINRRYGNPASFTNWKGLPGFFDAVKLLFTRKPSLPPPSALEKRLPIATPQFGKAGNGLGATWLGHATVLVQMQGVNFITDPVFCRRASPFSFIGPRRYRPVPCKVEDFPELHFGVISHNHYDHLDAEAVRLLSQTFPKMEWYVPAGLSNWMRSVAPDNIIKEFNWGEHKDVEFRKQQFRILCTPAQHWSARNLLDRNKTLWSGWAVSAKRGAKYKFFYSGDTGFCIDEFVKLGEKMGPFQLAAIPIGCYAPRDFMESQHIDPEEVIQIHKAIRAENTMGIHWGTYLMGSTEPYDEPPMKLATAAKLENLEDKIFTVDHGTTWVLNDL